MDEDEPVTNARPLPKMGAIPTPEAEIGAATPFRPHAAAPRNFLSFPSKLDFWGNDKHGDCVTAEEAFAQACHNPEVFIPPDVAIAWATAHGWLEGAVILYVMQAMQAGGFVTGGHTYDIGAISKVDWTNSATLQAAISQGPVKLGIAGAQLAKAYTWKNGWFASGWTADNNENHCTSLCGYGTISWLSQQLKVAVPAGVNGAAPGYAMFSWDTIGIIDQPSLNAVTKEAWLRSPTTVIK